MGAACGAYLQKLDKSGEVGQDDLCTEKAALAACEAVLTPREYQDLLPAVEAARKAAQARTAWRIDGTLREFPKFPPVNLWFDFPVHRNDLSGVLGDIDPEKEAPAWQRAMQKRKPKEVKAKERKASIETAFEACNFGDEVTLKSLAEYMGVSEDTVRRRLKEHGGFYNDGGKIGKKAVAKT